MVVLFVITRVETFFQKICDLGLYIETFASDYIIRQYALIPVVLNRPTADSQKFRYFLIRQKADVAEYRMMALPYQGNGIERLSCASIIRGWLPFIISSAIGG